MNFFVSGENIYQVTHNGRILENQDNIALVHPPIKPVLNELDLFATELLGVQEPSDDNTGTTMKLSISDINSNKECKRVTFDTIDINIDTSNLTDVMKDINFESTEENDLLEMLDMNENE